MSAEGCEARDGGARRRVRFVSVATGAEKKSSEVSIITTEGAIAKMQ